MKHLSEADMRVWIDAITHPPAQPHELLPWLDGPLRKFFPYKGVVLCHGELVAGQLRVTHMLSNGHDAAYLDQIATSFELAHRGSLRWWFANRRPFCIDPAAPPSHASPLEIQEIKRFGLVNVAGHGVLNIKANAGTYFGFAGVREPLSGWHLDALRLIAPVLNELLLCHFASEEEACPSPQHALTPRQRTIVRHVVAGHGNKVIGRALGISSKTVQNHLAAIYLRLGVHRRAELIALFR